jgi:ATPase subunit of ABC transporter with duplicated ATPase domains
LLSIHHLCKELGGRAVLTDVSFSVERGEVLGVVGPNGAGKTTLLRAIAGTQPADRGSIALPPGATIGLLAQGYAGLEGERVDAVFPGAFGSDAASDRLAEIAGLLAETSGAEHEALAAEYDRVLGRLAENPGVDLAVARAALGVRHVEASTRVGQLSGGELTKLGLLHLLATGPDVLLLDEPTNNLDIAGLEWLEEQVRRFRGAVLAVSHDRVFLDNCATKVLELDARGRGAELFEGNYSALLAEKGRREAEQWSAYERQQREEAQLKAAIHKIETRARGIEQSTIDFAKRKKALKIARRSTVLKARMERELASASHVERPEKQPHGFYGEFTAPAGATRLLAAEGVTLVIAGRTLVSGLELFVDRGECVVVTGPNGSGKTTLLRAVLGGIEPAAGTMRLSPTAKVGYLAQQDDPAVLAEDAAFTPVDLLRRTAPMTEAEATNFLHQFLIGHAQVRTPVGQLSYGERRRLALATLVRGGANLLILDEPTNHLDLASREAFEQALDGYAGASLVVSHDRRFIERFADRVLELE